MRDWDDARRVGPSCHEGKVYELTVIVFLGKVGLSSSHQSRGPSLRLAQLVALAPACRCCQVLAALDLRPLQHGNRASAPRRLLRLALAPAPASPHGFARVPTPASGRTVAGLVWIKSQAQQHLACRADSTLACRSPCQCLTCAGFRSSPNCSATAIMASHMATYTC